MATATTKQTLANAKQQSLLTQKIKQINPYTWPSNISAEQQSYGSVYPGWPVETDYSALAGLTPTNSQFVNPQQALAFNQTFAMGLNPFLVNPLMNPFANTLQNALNVSMPDGKQHSLFVFHLPEDVDDHGLLQLFLPYGATRANVMRQEDGRTKGFGFVHFNNRHDATIAIEMMNGHQIGRKRLMVSFKKNKNEVTRPSNLTQQ
ncbi:hypothetical protein RFI_02648 [Reticulomyxa filosa]|uniref:RRM domain-containing protein n=1 Tax=Reticulomyxa filosa TaxID=46433 RepID=X6P9Y1_RETFI|nr:hypothetical protein RFI_02648 [Reticulomyxa filosa]|eukprot:ETO34447.1 hypothetical protein RFI_02648 [Reticulomyxa filosa]